MRDSFILGKKIKLDRSSWKNLKPVPLPTPTPSVVPCDEFCITHVNLFSLSLTPETLFNPLEEISFKSNHFHDSLFFNELTQHRTPIKTMVISVEGLFKSSIEFSEARIGTNFGYKHGSNCTELLTGVFAEGVVELTKDKNQIEADVILKKQRIIKQNPVSAVLVETDNQIININSKEQKYLLLDPSLSRFTLTVDDVDGVTLINNHSSTHCNECYFSLAATNKVKVSSNQVFLGSNISLSGINGSAITMHYFVSGSPIIGISPNNVEMQYDPKLIIIPNPTLRVNMTELISQDSVFSSRVICPACTPSVSVVQRYLHVNEQPVVEKSKNSSTCMVLPTPTPSEVFDFGQQWKDNDEWNDNKIWKDFSALNFKT
jgi:hypothetical protein